MNGPFDTRFGILPVEWTDAYGAHQTSGMLSATWYDGIPVLTLTVTDGEPLLVQLADHDGYNATCGDSTHTYRFTVPPAVLTIISAQK